MPKAVHVLGISAYYHDSAACLVRNGEIVAAAQEERFTRKKGDPRFPAEAVNFCLDYAGIRAADLDYVVFYDKPLQKFDRLLETYLDYVPSGIRSFFKSMPLWLKEKLWIRQQIADKCGHETPILFTEHHESHAASAFFPSPYESAAVLTVDGVGEWATSSYGYGKGNEIHLLKELHFPHSLGLLYSAFTYFTGFKVNSGEYKMMGLAPYGEPRYVRKILDELMELKEDGSLWLNMKYFSYCEGLTMTNENFNRLFDGPPRPPESKLTQREMDLARSVQDITEMCMLRMAKQVHKETGERNLCLAGGVALNCVSNGRILREGPFENLWIQPAAGDAGGSLGAALSVWYQYLDNPRSAKQVCQGRVDGMQASYLGPAFTSQEVGAFLDRKGAAYTRHSRRSLIRYVAERLAEEKVVGWFQGRMEFGPRALGARSILGDPRSPRMQSMMNLKVKFRESFRPLAPSVLREQVTEYFEMDCDSPYMLLVAPVRSTAGIPAVTHVDSSARVHTVRHEDNPLYYELLKEFERLTGCAVLVNTSFNVRGEPVVCSPEDAYACFMKTEIDDLILEDFVLSKPEQAISADYGTWAKDFQLD